MKMSMQRNFLNATSYVKHTPGQTSVISSDETKNSTNLFNRFSLENIQYKNVFSRHRYAYLLQLFAS